MQSKPNYNLLRGILPKEIYNGKKEDKFDETAVTACKRHSGVGVVGAQHPLPVGQRLRDQDGLRCAVT
jgi:hypothetical protein